MKLKEGQWYFIYWDDTFSEVGWHTEKDIKKETFKHGGYIKTGGVFVCEHKGFYILARSHNEDKEMSPWDDPVWVPKGCIKHIVKLPKTKYDK